MSARCVIAHLSDLHFGNHETDVQNRLIDDLVSVEPRPDFVVVTGDLSERSKEPQLDAARKWLNFIIGKLADAGQETRYIVIPGNHDVGRRKKGKHWKRQFQSSSGGSGELVAASTQEYHTKRGSNPKSAEKLAANDFHYCEYYPGFGTAFLKFDSNKPSASWLRRLQNALTFWWWQYANGCVGTKQMQEMRDAIENYGKAFPEFQECRRIVLVHHHMHYLPDGKHEKFLLMEDAGPFWKTMLDLSVELILHGHKHYATNAVIRYLAGSNKTPERELMILAGGTACSKDLPKGQQYCYYRIETSPFKCTVWKRVHDETRFEGKSAPLGFRTWLGIHIPEADGSVSVAALDSILVSDEDDVDRNDYRSIMYRAEIDATRGYHMRLTLDGTNTTGRPFLRVPLVFVGARGRTLQPTGTDVANSTALRTEVSLHPSNPDKFYVRISLPAGVGKDASFAVQLEISVPDLMWEENDFDAVGFSRFVGELKEFEYELQSVRTFVEPQFYFVERSPTLTRLDPKNAASHSINQNRCHVRLTNPTDKGLGLLLHYRRLA